MRLFALTLSLIVSSVAWPALAFDPKPPPGWTEASRSNDMVLFYRENLKVHARELLGYTEFDAPPERVYKLLNDYEALPKLVPYTKESKILARVSANEFITYQLVSPPFVSDRDYFLRIKLTPGTPKTGGVYKTEWTAMPDYQKERDGVVRMKVNEGSWTYEPIDGGLRTRVTYSLLSHPGGSLPSWLVNRTSLKFIPALFKAVRDRLLTK